jgi:acetate kinase
MPSSQSQFRNILVLNAGSSSLKFRLLKVGISAGAPEQVLADGLVEKWGTGEASLRLSVGPKTAERISVAAESPEEAAQHAIRACLPLGIDALGHRVVHGGAKFETPVRIDDEVVRQIEAVSHLAPLHNGLALSGIRAGLKLLPDRPAVAVFDTAFHRTLSEVAYRYAIPQELADCNDLRRFGFHGISHQYVSRLLLNRLGRGAPGTRLITCHLGNGSSLCAIRDGRSVDTSMGLTPMEGLVMGTRSGDIDPGLVLHLINAMGRSGAQVDDLLNRRSGMLGLSGRSGDVRDLEQAAANGDGPADLALESFAYRARKYIGAYSAVLGGVDALAFAGGIGEHSAQIRSRICGGMEWLGLHLDTVRNSSAAGDKPELISGDQSRVQVWVIPTDEELQIAREVCDLLR